MPEKKISILLRDINTISKAGAPDATITGLTYDSRLLKRGDLFFALDGIHTNGHAFIAQAIEKGAAAVIHTKPLDSYDPRIAYIRVSDAKKLMPILSARFFDHPSDKLAVIGVTGTDGKSTTVSLIHQLLEGFGRKAGFLSTVSYKVADSIEKNPYRQSTPEATEIQALLHEMVVQGKEFAVIEATSHGLSEKTARLAEVSFDAGVFTNITHEHLEFHGSFEQYLSDKTNLFRALGKRSKPYPCFGVANLDDPHHARFIEASVKPVFTYSITRADADIYAIDLNAGTSGSEFVLVRNNRKYPVRIPLPGTFNVENTLAAALVIEKLLKVPMEEIVPKLPSLVSVRGRMNPILCGQDFSVIVDYAHTPGAFLKLFPQIRKTGKGRLIVVFGSAGERDTEKRSQQGKIAGEYCDLLVLTDEDPRGEESLDIIREIASGCPNRRPGTDIFFIPDRREAIRKAFALANSDDTVLLLGKGHEATIIYKDGPIPWDEIGVARDVLAEMGYRGSCST